MLDHALEFHRHAIALIPHAGDLRPGVAYYVSGNPSQHFCTCQGSGKKTCVHLKALFKAIDSQGSSGKDLNLEARFRNSVWHHLASVLSQGDRLTPPTTQARFYKNGDRTSLKVLTPDGTAVITYESANGDRNRFAERLGAFSGARDESVPGRAEIIHRLQLLTMTDAERQLHDLRLISRRQALEGSLWFRLAYHCFLEFDRDDCRFHPSVDETTGAFVITCKNPQQATIFHAGIARNRVRPLLDCFRRHLPNQHNLPIHPIPLKSLFRVSQNTATDLDVFPVIQLLQKQGEKRFFSREGLDRFIYGDLVYIPELKILAELEKPGRPRQFNPPRRMTFKRHQIPSFLESAGNELEGDGFVIDPDVKGLQRLRRWNAMTLAPTAIDRDWCWLSITYGFGDQSISLRDLLKARREATRYIGTPSGWVDTQAPAVETLAALAGTLPPDRFSEDGNLLKLSRQELFQFSAMEETAPVVAGMDDNAGRLSRFLALEPASPPGNPGLATLLRQYQQAGLNWLWWLWENRFGGLLCDDMGLGKTHQIMALMACIQQHEPLKKPFLVVCPTTVLSHWMMKLGQHAPALKAIVYYGGDRNLSATLRDADVLITSYGLLLRDIEPLKALHFSLVVFDEIQQIKNADTKTHRAASQLNAAIKVGLTGTPIENSVLELRALMDVVLPGYLGSSQAFCQRFMPEAAADPTASRNREQLRRLIFPFTLRRLKSRVLEELPEKIEDLRFCELTDKQVGLYRDAVDSRTRAIRSSLEDENQSIPYIHIFALLTLLKQICNHPALVDGQPVGRDSLDSGKWELFKELLGERPF